MKKYSVFGLISTSKNVGEFWANSKEEAEQMAWDSEKASINLCHHCANEIDEPEIREMVVEEVEE